MQVELISTQDLLVELTKRFDSFVVLGRKAMGAGYEFQHTDVMRWKGDLVVCQGLCASAVHAIEDSKNSTAVPINPETDL